MRSAGYLSTDALAKLVGISLVKVVVPPNVEIEATVSAVGRSWSLLGYA